MLIGGTWLVGALLLSMRLRQGDRYRQRIIAQAKAEGADVIRYPGVGSKLNAVFQCMLLMQAGVVLARVMIRAS